MFPGLQTHPPREDLPPPPRPVVARELLTYAGQPP